jgi:hypothetical protein
LIEPVGGVVDELLALLDGLATEDLAPLFGPALLERLHPLLVAQNRLAAEIAAPFGSARSAARRGSTG